MTSDEGFVVLPLQEGHGWICLFKGSEVLLCAKKVVELLGYSEAPSLELVELHAGVRYVAGVHQNLHKLSPEVESHFLFRVAQSFELLHHGEVFRVVCSQDQLLEVFEDLFPLDA